MKNKKQIIALLVVVVLLMTMAYSIFATQLNINATGNITSSWNVYFESISAGTAVGNASNVVAPSVTGTSANMSVNLELPGDSMTYEIVLKNSGTIGAIIENINANSSGSSGIIYTVSGLNVGDKLAGGDSKIITIKIEYDPNTTTQIWEISKTLTVTIDAVQDIGQTITPQIPIIEGEQGTLTKAILDNNEIQSDSYIDFSKPSAELAGYKEVHSETTTSVSMSSSAIYYYGTGYTFDTAKGVYKLTGAASSLWINMSTDFVDYPYTCQSTTMTGTCTTLYKMIEYTSATEGEAYKYTSEKMYSPTNGKGLYYTNTNTMDNKTTYYFRGDVANNYVSFAKDENGEDILWRIARINEDGSIRLIKQDNITNSLYNKNMDDNAYVGYMYGTPGSASYELTHANTTNSVIKEVLSVWYYDNLKTYEHFIASNAGFCNDRSVAEGLGYGYDYTSYGSQSRMNAPQFKCPNESQDLFTLTTSTRGNKKLTEPIGLLTVDEARYAGGTTTNEVRLNYLMNGTDWWTMSGGGLYKEETCVNHFTDDGTIYCGYDNQYGVRPVINLKSGVEILDNGADGTVDKPYIIKTN